MIEMFVYLGVAVALLVVTMLLTVWLVAVLVLMVVGGAPPIEAVRVAPYFAGMAIYHHKELAAMNAGGER